MGWERRPSASSPSKTCANETVGGETDISLQKEQSCAGSGRGHARGAVGRAVWKQLNISYHTGINSTLHNTFSAFISTCVQTHDLTCAHRMSVKLLQSSRSNCNQDTRCCCWSFRDDHMTRPSAAHCDHSFYQTHNLYLPFCEGGDKRTARGSCDKPERETAGGWPGTDKMPPGATVVASCLSEQGSHCSITGDYHLHVWRSKWGVMSSASCWSDHNWGQVRWAASLLFLLAFLHSQVRDYLRDERGLLSQMIWDYQAAGKHINWKQPAVTPTLQFQAILQMFQPFSSCLTTRASCWCGWIRPVQVRVGRVQSAGFF